jgi:hypothetical protein
MLNIKNNHSIIALKTENLNVHEVTKKEQYAWNKCI